MRRNAILKIYAAYNMTGKAFGNVLMYDFFTRVIFPFRGGGLQILTGI